MLELVLKLVIGFALFSAALQLFTIIGVVVLNVVGLVAGLIRAWTRRR